ncbi:cobalamin-binding protein [Algibacillus agarilyticus]|uniref:cobalamin-binding protein n=1 Tax=Algibacillus agarilyticus TaxID=2234133 RepID=UPI000DCFC012|nr:cobalamin-binding protein [Algibacillus agarilyticus]
MYLSRWLMGFIFFISFSLKANEESVNTQPRYITLAPHIIEMLFKLEVGDRVVATTSHSDFPEQAKHVPIIGNYARLKIEDILAYQPDIVFAWNTGNPADDLARLKQLGVNIVYSDPKTLEDVAKELRIFGELVGKSALAEKVALAYEQRLNAIKQRYQDKQTLKAFYELWSRPLTTVAKNAWPQQHLTICGVSNPFINGISDYPQVNVEQVVIADPEIIIQPMSAGEPNPDAVNWHKWKSMTAVKHGIILQPNSDKLHRMSTRMLDELDELCAGIDNVRLKYFNHNG